jgi:hypothetical protein
MGQAKCSPHPDARVAYERDYGNKDTSPALPVLTDETALG